MECNSKTIRRIEDQEIGDIANDHRDPRHRNGEDEEGVEELGDGPHEREMCQMCVYLGRACFQRRH